MSDTVDTLRIFLSHAGIDTNDAQDLCKKLEDRFSDHPDFEVFLDKGDKHSLQSGDWQKQLEEKIQEANVFIVLVGEAGIKNWVEDEVRLALSRASKKEIGFIPVLNSANISSAVLPGFTKRYHAIRDPLQNTKEMEKLVEAVAQARSLAPPRLKEPFIGLRSMGEEHNNIFFGRDHELSELIDRMRQERLVAIVADSGAGKSSLAQAGLAHAFRCGKLSSEGQIPEACHVLTMRPGNDPVGGLEDAVEKAAQDLDMDFTTINALCKSVQLNDFRELVRALKCNQKSKDIDTLLIVDQAEELVTQCSIKDRDAFLDLLLKLADYESGTFRILLTVRIDYFNLFSDHRTFFQRLNENSERTQIALPRLNDDAIEAVIQKPLQLAGYGLNTKEERNVSALVKAVKQDTYGRPGDTALIQFALELAWKHHLTTLSLTAAYIQKGRLYGALGRAAEEVYKSFNNNEKELTLPLFVRLVQPSETGGVTARTVLFEELDEDRVALARKLATKEASRLLQVSQDSVSISHEILIKQWSWLQNQIEKNGSDIRLLHRLTESAQAWQESERSDDRFVTGALLSDYVSLQASHPDWLSALEAKFIFHAEQERQSQIEQEKTRQREALMNQRLTLAVLSEAELSQGRPTEAAILALAAWPRAPEEGTDLSRLSVVLDTLGKVSCNLRESLRFIEDQNSIVNSIFSADGTRLALSLGNGTIKIINTESKKAVKSINISKSDCNDVAFSPDGQYFAIGGINCVIYDLETDKTITLDHYTSKISNVIFSHDSQHVITKHLIGTVQVTNIKTNHRSIGSDQHKKSQINLSTSATTGYFSTDGPNNTIRIFGTDAVKFAHVQGGTSQFTCTAFSPLNKHIVTGDMDGIISIWELSTGQSPLLRKFTNSEHPISCITISDACSVAVASLDGIIRVWDLACQKTIAVFNVGHAGQVTNIAFSANGEHLYAAGRNNIPKVWNLRTGKISKKHVLDQGDAVSFAFSSDGKLLAVGTTGQEIFIYNLESFKQVASLISGTQFITKVRFHANDKRLIAHSLGNIIEEWDLVSNKRICHKKACSAQDLDTIYTSATRNLIAKRVRNTVLIEDSVTGQEITTLQGHTSEVICVAFSSDGERLATGSYDETVRIWDLNTGQIISILEGHQGTVGSVAFSPSGSCLAVGSATGTLTIWNVDYGSGNLFDIVASRIDRTIVPDVVEKYGISLGETIYSGTEPLSTLEAQE